VSDVLETITQAGVVPIVEVSFPQQVEGVLSALRDGGLAVAEIVLRTPAALHAIALPIGGVTLENLEVYLCLPQVVACGTSAISARGLIESDDFAEIALRARTARAAVSRARPELAS
jgi:2-keto-3-deoxy-6-phosphogluconate aldolase